jgi:hypothetical protein
LDKKIIFDQGPLPGMPKPIFLLKKSQTTQTWLLPSHVRRSAVKLDFQTVFLGLKNVDNTLLDALSKA